MTSVRLGKHLHTRTRRRPTDRKLRIIDTARRSQHHRGRLRPPMRIAHPILTAAVVRRIFALERRIAEAHATRAASEDVKKGNNHWSRSDFNARAPGLDWPSFFSGAGLAQQ